MTNESRLKDDDFLEKTAERMKKIGLAGYDEIDEEDEDNEEEETSTSEETPTEDADDDPSSSEDKESDDTESSEDSEAGDETPTLSDALRRSAIHQEWTQEEIDEFMKADPEKAIKTFEKIHESNNRLTTEFSKLGQAALKVQHDADQSTTNTHQQDDVTKIIAGLGKEHDGDPLYEDFVKPLAQALKASQSQQVVQHVASPTVETRNRDRDGLVQQVNEFFSQETLRDYDEYYGTPGHPKTNDQLGSYNQVLQLADQIVAGSILQQNELSVPEALDKAHLVIAEPFRQTATQNALKVSVKKREKGVQLKPNSSASTVDDGNDRTAPKSRSELHSRTRERLQKVFNT